MDETKLAAMIGNALGTGTAVAVLLLILWRVLKGIAERWIASLDDVAKCLREHTERDLQSHRTLGDRVAAGQADVKDDLRGLSEGIVRVETKLDSARDWMERTPTGEPSRRKRTNPQGHRPRGNDNDD